VRAATGGRPGVDFSPSSGTVPPRNAAPTLQTDLHAGQECAAVGNRCHERRHFASAVKPSVAVKGRQQPADFGALKCLAPGIWIARSPLRFWGVEVGRLTTVVRLRDGQLLIYSPAPLTAGLSRELTALGEVRFVVPASNLHGHRFMEQYRNAFPTAELWAAPMLDRKRRDLWFDGLLGSVPDPRWSDDLDQAAFMGNRWLTEIVFLHRASGTLLVGDLAYNLGPGVAPLTKLVAWLPFPSPWGGLWTKLGPSALYRRSVRNRLAARHCIEEILDWEFDRIIVGHGEIVETGGHDAFRTAFGWLLEPPRRTTLLRRDRALKL